MKCLWGEFMQHFQMTVDYLEKNIVNLYCVSDDEQCDKPMGFYSFSVNMKEPELDNFFIAPDYIGKGFGKKMGCVKKSPMMPDRYPVIFEYTI